MSQRILGLEALESVVTSCGKHLLDFIIMTSYGHI